MKNAPSLRRVAKAGNKGGGVLFGRKELAAGGAPPRIVLVPIGGTNGLPSDVRALADEVPSIAAHIWGTDYDDVQDLTARLYQALDEQAHGVTDDTEGAELGPAGFFWKNEPGTVTWEDDPQVASNGEVKVVVFSIIMPLARTARRVGLVERARMTKTDNPNPGVINIPGYAAQVLSLNPAAYYKFAEASGAVCNDSSGNARHGVLSGALTYGVRGLVNGTGQLAIKANGSTSAEAYINGGAGMSIDGDRSFDYWVTLTSLANNDNVLAVSAAGAIRIAPQPDGSINWGWNFNTSSPAPAGTLTLGERYHIGFSWNATTGVARLYVNAVEVATKAIASLGGAWTTWVFNEGHAWGGTLDELALYPSELSAADFLANFTEGTA